MRSKEYHERVEVLYSALVEIMQRLEAERNTRLNAVFKEMLPCMDPLRKGMNKLKTEAEHEDGLGRARH